MIGTLLYDPRTDEYYIKSEKDIFNITTELQDLVGCKVSIDIEKIK